MNPEFHMSGDKAFIVRFGYDIDIKTHRKVKNFTRAIEQLHIRGVSQIVPAYCDVTVCYDPAIIDYETLLSKLKAIDINTINDFNSASKLIHIPVCYHEEFAPDLSFVARHNELDVEEVINLHSSVEYLVYMLGFTPGFVYLGGLDKKITTPRKYKPRQKIKAGAVGIADKQTGVYPIDSPGGWQIIGKTPLKMFDISRTPEVLIQSGDHIKFDPISPVEYHDIKEAIRNKQYFVKSETIMINNGQS